nr:unnamed protein product [Callosobruchus chinensis]
MIMYKLESGSDGLFSVDEWSGVITLRGNLKSSSKHRLIVSAQDRGDKRAPEDATIEIIKESYVKELHFDSFGGYEFQILEDPGNSTIVKKREVGTVRLRDGEAVYSILYGDVNGNFDIDENTGRITTSKSIDREQSLTYSLTVVARTGLAYGETTVNIVVQDLNDNRPVFAKEREVVKLLEDAAVGQEVYVARARDLDAGINSRVSYNLSHNPDNQFRISDATGVIYLNRPIQADPGTQLHMEVTATDGGTPPLSSKHSVTIIIEDVNDHTPVFDHTSYETSLLESTPVNERFFALAASDADLGRNGVISYEITEGNNEDKFGIFQTATCKLTATDRDIGRNAELIFSLSSLQNDFSVDPKNGFIKTLHVFDREMLVQATGQNFMSIEAVVTDNGNPRLRDKSPLQDTNIGRIFDRTQVLRLYSSDADEGLNGDVFYKITGGNGDGNFEIDEATGQISLARSLDRETISKYTLTVVAHDAGIKQQLSSFTTVEVDILDENDNAPEFTQTESKISISEVKPVNTELIQFKASDADLGVNSEVFYSITAGNRKDTFHIDTMTGMLYLHKPLDYEELASYHLNITASDNGNPRLSTTILFSVLVQDANDNPPSFPSTAIVRQIREGIPVHTPIVTVAAEDPDSSINGKVTYAISHQEPENTKRHFGIDPVTGVIHTLLPIDREAIDTFRLTVVASDQAEPLSSRLSAEKLVTVIVEDVNDNAPVFVSMNAAVLPKIDSRKYREEVVVLNVFARDLDSATNGLVTYELASGNSDLFWLDQSTGALKLKRPIFNPEPTYRLSVKATDEAVQSERKYTETYLTVIATNDTENGPKLRVAYSLAVCTKTNP